MPFPARACVEMFQLVFLRALVAKGEDKALVALKGGCNLRFYFVSVRYSEDIDFDVVVIAPGTLKNKVERLLRSPLVSAPLRTRGLEVTEVSAPKQTETTQRWKVALRAEGFDAPLRTKIEFSRRDAIEGATYEGIARSVLGTYGLTQVLATHYATRAAIEQKVHALAGRAEPQARDVFDLALLLSRPDADKIAVPPRRLRQAIDSAVGISFDEFSSKVVAYLDPDHAELYGTRDAWNAIQAGVLARLEALP
jgi:predicted nucleotidyltransferase component of viral defense system